MILIKECNVYSPDFLGRKDVLIAGGKIISIQDEISELKDLQVEVIRAGGMKLIPGLIDAHIHIAGAGGEGGPATRTPEIQLSSLLKAGVTSVVGCLGTDGFTRSLETLLMKVKSLRAEGVSAWMYTGAYQVPTPTITGDVGKDISLFEEIIGVGEIAISDHRSSHPTTDEFIRIAAHARVGGMLGGKAGIVNVHMGDAPDPFKPVRDAVKNSEVRYKQFLPTHCNRNHYIFEDAKKYGKKGYVDLTTSSYPYFPDIEIKPSVGLAELLSAGVPLEHITFTSDACGSLPEFDKEENLVKLEMGFPKSIFIEVMDAVREGMKMEKALKVATSNVADILKLKGKGRIMEGHDADLLLIDDSYEIRFMIANGTIMVRDGKIMCKGAYE